jgi:RNA polymerase-associated protein RTF1
LHRYKVVCQAEKIPLPSRGFLNKKIADIDGLLKHQFTEAELLKKLDKSGVRKSKYAILERHAIKARREEAVLQGDEAMIAQCDAELLAMQGPKLAFGTSNIGQKPSTSLPKPSISSSSGINSTASSQETTPRLSQQDRLAELNRINRKHNKEEIRKAQIAEKRAEQRSLASVMRGESQPNPFARVKTRAKVMHLVDAEGNLAPGTPGTAGGGSDSGLFGSRDVTPLSLSRAGTPLGSQGQSQNSLRRSQGSQEKGLPQIKRAIGEDDIIAGFGIEVDVDIDI